MSLIIRLAWIMEVWGVASTVLVFALARLTPFLNIDPEKINIRRLLVALILVSLGLLLGAPASWIVVVSEFTQDKPNPLELAVSAGMTYFWIRIHFISRRPRSRRRAKSKVAVKGHRLVVVPA